MDRHERHIDDRRRRGHWWHTPGVGEVINSAKPGFQKRSLLKTDCVAR